VSTENRIQPPGRTADEWATYYMRMASELYDLVGHQTHNFAELSRMAAPHLPAAAQAELAEIVDRYVKASLGESLRIANGMVSGPRTPPGCRLVWAVPGSMDNDYSDRYLCTDRELADSLVGSGCDPEPRLLYSVAPAKLAMHTRRVHFVQSGVCSDHTHSVHDANPQDYPTSLVDPQVRHGRSPSHAGGWWVTGQGPDPVDLNRAVDQEVADLSTRLDNGGGYSWEMDAAEFNRLESAR
jgi:hypothetical protein